MAVTYDSRLYDALPADARARVTIVEADMRTFALDRRFALIVAPFRAFLHNLTHEDQLACLQRVRAHLVIEAHGTDRLHD